jgi:hypothetical protein
MMHKKLMMVAAAILIVVAVMFAGCSGHPTASDSGVSKVSVQIQTQPSGLTVEQENVARRLTQDNTPGSIKHLYLISPYNNRVIYYSTVTGKITSGGKRITPITISDNCNGAGCGMPIFIGNEAYHTPEVIQDDGTYGTSGEYIYWWDTKDIYHQLYIGSGILMVTSEPVNINTGTTISVEQLK